MPRKDPDYMRKYRAAHIDGAKLTLKPHPKPPRIPKPKPKPIGRPIRVIPIEVKCEKCGSNEHLTLNGWAQDKLRRKYFCKPCRHRFVFPRLPKPSDGLKWHERRSLNANHFQREQKMEANKIIHLSHLTVNSLDGIPCFLCSDQQKCDKGSVSTSPILCYKLSAWIDSPPIHEYVESVKEYELENLDKDFEIGR